MIYHFALSALLKYNLTGKFKVAMPHSVIGALIWAVTTEYYEHKSA